MKFIFLAQAGNRIVEIRGGEFTHLCKSIRKKVGSSIDACNLQEYRIYTYKITEIARNSAILELLNSKEVISSKVRTHIICAMIDPKNIEKVLPALNELGLYKLTFFYAVFSQHNYVLNLARVEKILVHSCEQCGRIDKLKVEVLPNLQHVKEKYKDFVYLDTHACLEFNIENLLALSAESSKRSSVNYLDSSPNLVLVNALPSIMIGPEAGFSKDDGISAHKSFFIKGNLTLQAHNACIYVASVLKFLA